MYPHRIRLRGPWECEPANLPARRVTMPGRWGDIGLGEFAGAVRLRRRFGYPSRIDPHEAVWLTLDGVGGRATILLNGHLLAATEKAVDSLEFPVTSFLQPRNELIVDLEASGPQSGLWGEVALEVRCSAYLRSVGVDWTADCLTVHGEVVGTAEGPLELYVLVDGRTVVYSPVSARPEGQPFRFVSEPLVRKDFHTESSTQRQPPSPAGGGGLGGGVNATPSGDVYPSPPPPPPTGEGEMDEVPKPHEVRVDLVSGAVVWYTWARTQDLR